MKTRSANRLLDLVLCAFLRSGHSQPTQHFCTNVRKQWPFQVDLARQAHRGAANLMLPSQAWAALLQAHSTVREQVITVPLHPLWTPKATEQCPACTSVLSSCVRDFDGWGHEVCVCRGTRTELVFLQERGIGKSWRGQLNGEVE
jgi:hypothetical protein